MDCNKTINLNQAAVGMVGGAYEATWSNLVGRYNTSWGQSGDLACIELCDFDFPDVTLNLTETLLSDVQCHEAIPPVTDGDFDPKFESLRTTFDLTLDDATYTPGGAPGYNVTDPGINVPAKPDVEKPDAPGAAPVIGDVTLPAVPDTNLPPVPTLRDITLPTPDELDLPTFNGDVPDDANIFVPSGTFSWEEEDYIYTILDQAINRVSIMFQGGTGLPDPIWDLIWDRARERLTVDRDAAIQEATERWAARGFAVPGGALNSQINMAIEKFNDLSAEQLRETAIKAAELEVEQLRFAVEKGIAIEQLIMDLWNNVQNRALDAAKTVYNIAIKLFEAQIAKYNADAQVYQVQAQVHKTLIEAELSKLEEYKLRLEGQKLIGDLNLQEVQIYTARVDAATKIIQLYVAEIEGVKAQVSVDKAQIDAYVAQVGAYGERVKANVAEYQAYKYEVEGEVAKADIFKSQVQAYGSRVDAYAKEVGANVNSKELILKKNAQELDKFKAMLNDLELSLKKESARLEAEYRDRKDQVEVNNSNLQAAKLKYDVELSRNKIDLDQVRLDQDRYLAELKAEVDKLNNNNRLQVESAKASAQLQAQLVSAAFSAVNLSASVGYSAGESIGYSQSCNASVSAA